MLGICPNCKIRLDVSPFNGRETNEMMLILAYRKFIDNHVNPRSVDDIGYCEVCNAKKSDIEKQNKIKVTN